MNKILSALCATALTASVAVTGAFPANAAPAYVPKAAAVQSDVIPVRDRSVTAGDGPIWKRRMGNKRFYGKNWDGPRNWDGPKYGWYKGYKGYPYRRHYNDRYHNGLWFPAGAFIAGAIIGGAIANSNTYYRGGGGSAHVEWCYDRYRSYREWDNTFQPYNGPRQQCYSPYS